MGRQIHGGRERWEVVNQVLADTEWVRLSLGDWTESWLLRSRETADLNWSPLPGHRRFITLKAGLSHVEDTDPRFIWVQATAPPQTVELETWGRV